MEDFDLTQTDAQVQSILNDAQNAQGAGAQTTLTTDYIMLKDTSGNYHKILKDSFTEACRNVLAGLLVNNDKGTTISQIPAIASGDFGSVTPANLASVLGGLVTTISVPANGSVNAPSVWASRIVALRNNNYSSVFSVFSVANSEGEIVRVSQTSGGISINNETKSSQLHISTIDDVLVIENNSSSSKSLSWRIL